MLWELTDFHIQVTINGISKFTVYIIVIKTNEIEFLIMFLLHYIIA